MKIEHLALQVNDPYEMAEWYAKHLGFIVKRKSTSSFPLVFISDDTEKVMLELYNNPSVETPDYATMNPLLLHLAFVCNEIPETTTMLTNVGASLLSGPDVLPSGDILVMLRDPWGLAIQLCYRTAAMV